MTFPDVPIELTGELYYDGGWNDVSSDIRGNSQEIRITNRGRPNEASRPQPSACNLTFGSVNGKYSNRNPNSSLYGLLGRNTPFRLRVGNQDSYMFTDGTFPSYAETDDSAALDITGDIDIRADIDPESWTNDLGLCIAAKYLYTGGNQRSWALLLGAEGKLKLVISPDGTSGAAFTLTSTTAINPAGGRMTVRATLDVNDGSGNNVAKFYTSDSVTGTFAQVGSTVTTVGTTSIFASTADVLIGAGETGTGVFVGYTPFVGRIYRVQVYQNIAGTLRADANFIDQEPGTTSFVVSANTFTVNKRAHIENDSYRFAGEVPVWPVEWDNTGNDIRVPIEAAGILRRLGQGAQVVDSPMMRHFSNHPDVLAHWSMEDLAGSSRAASTTSGAASASVTDVDFAADSDLPGANPVVKFSSTSSKVGGSFPSHAAGTQCSIAFSRRLTAVPAADCPIFNVSMTGSGARWVITAAGAAGYDVDVYDSDGTLVDLTGFGYGAGADPDQWTYHVLSMQQSGGNIAWEHSYYAQGLGIVYSTGTQTFAGTLGKLIAWSAGATADSDDSSIAHVIGATDADSLLEDASLDAIDAYDGEKAGDRIERICGEEGISLIMKGDTFYSPRMGTQSIDTALNIIYECIDVDMGMIFESRSELGLTVILRRRTLINTYPTCELSYSSKHLADSLKPVEDDQTLANRVTVTRKNGSSHTSADETSALSINEPTTGTGVGKYEAFPITVNVDDDEALQDQSGIRLLHGTWDEQRYPKISVWLQREQIASDAYLLARVKALDCGKRLIITDTPDWQPARDVDVLVNGYSETISNFRHEIDYVTTPFGPYRSAIVGFDSFVGTGSVLGTTSTLVDTGIDDNDTTISITSNTGWDTAVTDLDIEINGERMNVTAVAADMAGLQDITVTRSVNGVVKSHAAGSVVTLWDRTFIPR